MTTPSPPLLNRLIAETPAGTEPGEHVARELKRIEDVRRLLAAVEERLDKAAAAFEVAKRVAATGRRDIQQSCRHLNIEHFPDVAGGYDSEERCQDCGLGGRVVTPRSLAEVEGT